MNGNKTLGPRRRPAPGETVWKDARQGRPPCRQTGLATLLCGAACIITLPALAQTQPATELDTIVVTASRRETEARTAPVAATVITRKEIERKGGSSVAELLRDVPGVTIDEASFPGMKRIRIRGEEARRGMVLIDGQEISDHTTYGPPMLIDPALIERIEVVRGPLSVLYGARAIGGVVNIITKKPAKRPAEMVFGARYDSSTHGYNAFAMASGTVGAFNYRLFTGRSEDGNRRTPAGTLPNSSFDTRSLNLRFGYEEGPHKLALEYDRHELATQSSTPRGLVDGVNFTAYQLNLPQRDREKFAVSYDGLALLPGMARLHIDGFYQTIDRHFLQNIAGTLPPPPRPPGSYDYANDDFDNLRSIGFNALIDWDVLPGHILTTGVQSLRDRLDRTTRQTGWLDPPGTAPRGAVNITYDQLASITTHSAFLQDTWSFAPDWQAILGARYSFVDAELSRSTHPTVRPAASEAGRVLGSAALVWTPTPALSLRAGWGQAFVYPTLLQLHTGTIVGSAYRINPNPELRPETSDSFEIGARWQQGPLRLEASAFYTKARNYIASLACASLTAGTCPSGEFQYVNSSAARTYGAELGGSYRLPFEDALEGLEVYGNVTVLRRELAFRNPGFETFSSGMPLAAGRFGLRQEFSVDARFAYFWDAYVRAAGATRTRTSRALTRTGDWATLNLAFGISYQAGAFGEHRLSVELLNLADKRYQPSPDELIQPGRTLRLAWRSAF